MRAARIRAWGRAPVVEDVPSPQRRAGETLVRVEAAAVSHLDLTVAGGEFGIRPALPYVGGVEGCGVVVDSASFRPGTLVNVRGGGLGLDRDGTWAELVVAPDGCVTEVPPGLTAELGATYRQPVTTAAVALTEVAQLGRWPLLDVSSPVDELVLVTGAAGSVGSAATQLALRLGCRVLGLVSGQRQASRLPAGVGAVLADDASGQEELARKRPVTLMVDTLGGADLAGRLGWITPGGRAAVVGYVSGTGACLDLPRWLLDDVSLLPVNMMRRQQAATRYVSELAPLVASGELTVNVQPFPLEEAAVAVTQMRAGGLSGRVVLRPRSAERALDVSTSRPRAEA
jgi:NADPH:quinone reductase-like Zn-dependent oxidoreductase